MANRQDVATSQTNLLAARLADLVEAAGWYDSVLLIDPNKSEDAAEIAISSRESTTGDLDSRSSTWYVKVVRAS